jgi:uncharacterized Zn-binding protein involved in type VI secretion
MTKPAARITDRVIHLLPPVLTPAPGSNTGSPNVLIGNLPAWRGISAQQLAQLMKAVAEAEIAIKKAEAATKLATGRPEQGVAEANELKVKIEQNKKIADIMLGFAAVADIHLCVVPLPPPVHGPGVVINGSNTVLINGQPASRQGDSILEANILANIPPLDNKIDVGLPTVLIGD